MGLIPEPYSLMLFFDCSFNKHTHTHTCIYIYLKTKLHRLLCNLHFSLNNIPYISFHAVNCSTPNHYYVNDCIFLHCMGRPWFVYPSPISGRLGCTQFARSTLVDTVFCSGSVSLLGDVPRNAVVVPMNHTRAEPTLPAQTPTGSLGLASWQSKRGR